MEQDKVLERLRVGVRVGRRGGQRRRIWIGPAIAQDFAEHADEEDLLAVEAAIPIADVAGGQVITNNYFSLIIYQ